MGQNFLDIETVFREDVRKSLELAYPKPPAGNPVDPESVDTCNVKQLEELISTAGPDLNSLFLMVQQEQSGKNRVGALEVLEKAIRAKDPDCIPDHVKMMPECCEIICACYGREDVVDTFCSDEKSIIQGIWELVEQDHSIGRDPAGWALANFDIPVLLAASRRHGISPPKKIAIHSKYSFDGFVDLFVLKGSPKQRLRDLCLATGFTRDCEDPLGSGAAVARAWEAGDLDSIVDHCEVDILRCDHIYNYYEGLLW